MPPATATIRTDAGVGHHRHRRRSVSRRPVPAGLVHRSPRRTGLAPLHRLVDQLHAVAGDLLHLVDRSEEHTSELQSLMRNSYAVFCLKKTNTNYIFYCTT